MLREIESPEDPLLQVFYDFYQRVYVSERGRASLESFRELLRLNERRCVQQEFGPLCERIAVLLDAQASTPIGAASYVLYAHHGQDAGSDRFAGSCQLNFLCVHPSHRGHGLSRVLLYHIDRQLTTFVFNATGLSRPRVFLTIEQTDDEQLTTGQGLESRAEAGIDLFRRRRWWAKQGYRQLEFPYQRPAPRAGVESCTHLDYFARVPCEAERLQPSLPSRALLEHLRRSFLVSAGKLAHDTSFSQAWHTQRSHLLRRGNVPLR